MSASKKKQIASLSERAIANIGAVDVSDLMRTMSLTGGGAGAAGSSAADTVTPSAGRVPCSAECEQYRANFLAGERLLLEKVAEVATANDALRGERDALRAERDALAEHIFSVYALRFSEEGKFRANVMEYLTFHKLIPSGSKTAAATEPADTA